MPEIQTLIEKFNELKPEDWSRCTIDTYEDDGLRVNIDLDGAHCVAGFSVWDNGMVEAEVWEVKTGSAFFQKSFSDVLTGAQLIEVWDVFIDQVRKVESGSI